MPESYAVRWDRATQQALEEGLFAFVDPAQYLSLETGWEQALYRFLAEHLRWKVLRRRVHGSALALRTGGSQRANASPDGAVRGPVTVYARAGDIAALTEAYGGGRGLPFVLGDRLEVVAEEGVVPWLAPALDRLASTGLFTWQALPPFEQEVEDERAVSGDHTDPSEDDAPGEGGIPPEASDEAVLAFTLVLSDSEVDAALAGYTAGLPTPDPATANREDVWRSLSRLFLQPGEDEAVDYLRWVW